MQKIREKYGPYALITGASSGIGKSYACLLSAMGFNLILAARRKPLLDEIAKTLSKQNNTHSLVVEADLSLQSGIDHLIAETKSIDVGLLINNAADASPGAFFKNDLSKEKSIIQLNILTPLELSHHFGKRLVERGRGGLIWVGSTMGLQGVPYVANYSATKAYAEIFCRSLQYELTDQQIDVQVVIPGPTQTGFAGKKELEIEKLPLNWMTPEQVVRASLMNLGKKTVVIPGEINKAFALLGSNWIFKDGIASLMGKFAKDVIPKEDL